MRELLGEMAERLRMLDNRLMQYERRITRIYRQDERCRRLRSRRRCRSVGDDRTGRGGHGGQQRAAVQKRP